MLRRILVLASPLVLTSLVGCYRFEPLYDDGPVIRMGTLTHGESPRIVERLRVHHDGTSLTPTQCLVDRDRLLVLGFEFDGKRSVPAVADFRLANGSLALDKFDLVLDHQASLLALMPGDPPAIVSHQYFAYRPAPHLLTNDYALVDFPHDSVELRASGKFAAADGSWLLIPPHICGSIVKLLEWDGTGFSVLESNDYNEMSADFRIASDGEYASVLIGSHVGLQLLRHTPESGESLMLLDRERVGYNSAVSVSEKNTLCAWIRHETAVAVSDGIATWELETGTELCSLKCLLAHERATVIVQVHPGVTAVMKRNEDGAWTMGPGFPHRFREGLPAYFGDRLWFVDRDGDDIVLYEILD